MGYEIIIRREDESEITRQEIEAFADFHIQEGLTGTNPRTGEVMTLEGECSRPQDVPRLVAEVRRLRELVAQWPA
jgi:hypothetical protein